MTVQPCSAVAAGVCLLVFVVLLTWSDPPVSVVSSNPPVQLSGGGVQYRLQVVFMWWTVEQYSSAETGPVGSVRSGHWEREVYCDSTAVLCHSEPGAQSVRGGWAELRSKNVVHLPVLWKSHQWLWYPRPSSPSPPSSPNWPQESHVQT